MKELDLLKEVKEKTLQRILEKHGRITEDLKELQLSIWDARVIIYEVIDEIAEREFKEVF